MSKFNSTATKTRTNSPLRTSETATGTTYEGHKGYGRDTKSALFLLAVSNFVGENTFYEKARDRDQRFRDLVRRSTIEDPQWTADLLRWLRGDGNMRSASLVGAAEYAKVCLENKIKGSRAAISSVLMRADEQAFNGWRGDVSAQAPANIPIYAFNCQGYEHGMLPDDPNRVQLGSLTDHTFSFIPQLEAGKNGSWDDLFHAR